MKRVELPLSELTVSQKLDLLETIWTDLIRDEESLESPAWHEAILRNREAAYESGKVGASDWEEAKEKIRKKIS